MDFAAGTEPGYVPDPAPTKRQLLSAAFDHLRHLGRIPKLSGTPHAGLAGCDVPRSPALTMPFTPPPTSITGSPFRASSPPLPQIDVKATATIVLAMSTGVSAPL